MGFGSISQAAIEAKIQSKLNALSGGEIDFNDTLAQLNTNNVAGAIEALDSRLDAIASSNPDTLTLYVAPSGDNNNNGLTLATAFAHPFYACLKLANYNLQGSNVLINIAPGTYNDIDTPYQIPGSNLSYSDSGRILKFPQIKGQPKSLSIVGTGATKNDVVLQANNFFGTAIELDRAIGSLVLQKLTLKKGVSGSIGSVRNNDCLLLKLKIDSDNLTLENGKLEIQNGIEFAGAGAGLNLIRMRGGSSGNTFVFNNASGSNFLTLTDSQIDWLATYSGTFTGQSFSATRSVLNYNNLPTATASPTIDNFSIVNGKDYKNTASGLLAQTKQAAIDELKNLVSSINIATITANLQLQNNSARIQDLTNPSSTQFNILLPPTPQIAKEFLIINEEVSVSNFSVNGSIVAPGDRYGIAWNGNKWLEL